MKTDFSAERIASLLKETRVASYHEVPLTGPQWGVPLDTTPGLILIWSNDGASIISNAPEVTTVVRAERFALEDGDPAEGSEFLESNAVAGWLEALGEDTRIIFKVDQSMIHVAGGGETVDDDEPDLFA